MISISKQSYIKNGVTMMDFDEFFIKATGIPEGSFPWQRKFAVAEKLPSILDIPTGLGKTAGAVLGWLWRRRYADPATRSKTPGRLVYCLPMRVLVRQTVENLEIWFRNLGILGDPGEGLVSVNMLMGGEVDQSEYGSHGWDAYPEEDAVLVGTQDQLLSRALFRGYSMSRFKWPVHGGLLNNDAFWVIDETQLMGAGFCTSAQLNGLRDRLGTLLPCRTVWMSATLFPKALHTVDNADFMTDACKLSITDEDIHIPVVRKRMEAVKKLHRVIIGAKDISSSSPDEYCDRLAKEVLRRHVPGTLTLVMLNRVNRARKLFIELRSLVSGLEDPPPVALLHSRFREHDRRETELLLTREGAKGIFVSTQVLEAGVDVSAKTLFSELAPWPSMVQRFGRCNRYGEYDYGEIYWIDIIEEAENDSKRKDVSSPYDHGSLESCKSLLLSMDEADIRRISGVSDGDSEEVSLVPRKRDILQLFDTSPDLMGFDVDVSDFIRKTRNNDLQVFWRNWKTENGTPPSSIEPSREELCGIPVFLLRDFLGKIRKKNLHGWIVDHVEGTWRRLNPSECRPGLVVLLSVEAGGYSDSEGWTGISRNLPSWSGSNEVEDKETFTGDYMGYGRVPLAEHTRHVREELEEILQRMDLSPQLFREVLREAASWHDAGKAHEAFQNMVGGDTTTPLAKGGSASRGQYFVKTPAGIEKRPFFRHELVSALWYLDSGSGDPLVAYLVAAHHGKVRMSIRSNPREPVPGDERRYTCGVREGDILYPVQADEGLYLPGFTVKLGLMEVGGAGSGESWTSMTRTLLNRHGPYRLAMLEALLRVADWRASRKEAR